MQEVAAGWETGPQAGRLDLLESTEAQLLDLLGKWGGILTFSLKHHGVAIGGCQKQRLLLEQFYSESRLFFRVLLTQSCPTVLSLRSIQA